MPENQKFCPKCGTANKIDAKFCRSCREKLASAGGITVQAVQKAADVANTVASTVSKVGSAVSTAGRIAETAGELSQVVIRPPAEWKVVVGDMLPVAGQKIAESAVTAAGAQVQQAVQQKVQEEVVRQVSKAVSKPVSESVVPDDASPRQQQHGFRGGTSPAASCPNCGNPVRPGAKFCQVCGGATAAAGKADTVTNAPAVLCPSCGNALVPGKKFCGSCGYKLG